MVVKIQVEVFSVVMLW